MPLLLALQVWVINFATGAGGLVAGGDTGQWQWAVPTAGPGGSDAMWATNPHGSYLHEATDWVEIPGIDLAGVADPTLVLDHWYVIRAGDVGVLEVDDGLGFVVHDPIVGKPDPTGFVGDSMGIVTHAYDLRSFGDTPRIRLRITSNETLTAAGWYVTGISLVDGDVVAPVVTERTFPVDTQDVDGPYLVEVDVTDDRFISAVTAVVSVDGGAESRLPMAPGGGNRFAIGLPAAPVGSTVSVHVEATDGENLGRWPAVGDETFRVFLAAPTGLRAVVAAGRPVATDVELKWEAPASPHAVQSYAVYAEGGDEPVAEISSLGARVPVVEPQRYQVSAIYAAGEGDRSEVVQTAFEVPEVLSVSPAVAFQGQTLYVEIAGRSLYLLDGETTVDFGPAVTVASVAVRDAHSATVRVTVDADAPLGLVRLDIDGPIGSFSFEGGFDVQSGDALPRIERIEPDALTQGDERQIELEASVPFARPPTVGTDSDLFLTSTVTVTGPVARFRLAAAGNARPGPHTLTLDDGSRLYTVTIDVTEWVAPLRPGCATGPVGGGISLVLLALLWGRRGHRDNSGQTGGARRGRTS